MVAWASEDVDMTDHETLPAAPAAGARPRVVLDTDTFNEIDDQFALAYLLRAADRAETEAIYAAPFVRGPARTAAEGMEASYREIGRLLQLLGRAEVPAFRGSERFLREPAGNAGPGAAGAQPARGPAGNASPSATSERPAKHGPAELSPVNSPAARDLAERAMSATHSDRLTVIAIGALTNVASAILLEPGITERATVVWLGGHYPYWPHQNEFNLTGDPAAASVVFDSGVPLYVVPCLGVASVLRTTEHELGAYLGADPLSRFLLERFRGATPATCAEPGGAAENGAGPRLRGAAAAWSRVIWDIAAVAWVVLPAAVESFQIATPRLAPDGSYTHDPRRHVCRFACQLDRDAVYRDMFARLSVT